MLLKRGEGKEDDLVKKLTDLRVSEEGSEREVHRLRYLHDVPCGRTISTFVRLKLGSGSTHAAFIFRGNVKSLTARLGFSLRNLVLLRWYTGFPLVLGRDVLLKRILLALSTIEVLTVCSAGDSIVVPEETTLPQLGQQKIDDVLERPREEGISLSGR